MPELPEVETIRTGLARCLPGRRAVRIELSRTDLRWPIPVPEVRRLAERTCTAVERRAKYLQLHFAEDARERSPIMAAPRTALIHLGMSGRLFVDRLEEGERSDPWRQHEHWRMHFRAEGERERFVLRFVDPRRFGSLDACRTEDLTAHPRLRMLGPEPFDEDAFDAEYLFRTSRGRRSSTRALLMDARIVVGVGNIYTSEACFRARVRPGRAAGRLTRATCTALVDAIRTTLRLAIEAGGTTLRDYVGIDEDSGYFQQQLLVYGRDGEACRVCGSEIRRTIDNGRSSFWCRECQS